jgi:hypothetical protein
MTPREKILRYKASQLREQAEHLIREALSFDEAADHERAQREKGWVGHAGGDAQEKGRVG